MSKNIFLSVKNHQLKLVAYLDRNQQRKLVLDVPEDLILKNGGFSAPQTLKKSLSNRKVFKLSIVDS